MTLNVHIDIVYTYYTTHYPMTPRYVTIHNAATKGSAKQIHEYNKACITGAPDGIKSWHYSVDEAEAYQALPDNINAWHAGDGNGPGNRESISIEIARDLDYSTDLYQRSEDNAARLAAFLLKKYNLSVNDLRRHYDWSGKICPHRIIEADSWDDFKSKVAGYMSLSNPISGSLEPEKAEKKTDTNKIYRVQVGAFKEYKNAKNMMEELKAIGYDPYIIEAEDPTCPRTN